MRQRNLGNVKENTTSGAGKPDRSMLMMTSNSGGRAAIGVRSADGGASTLT